MKRIYLIHGWEGNPNNCWFPWLRQNLESRGYEVIAPEMPAPSFPDPELWPQKLAEAVQNPGAETILVGHSIGCQAIMRYLQTIAGTAKIGAAIFVAPFFELLYLQTQEEKDIWKKWQEMPIDTEKVKQAAGAIVSIFSDNDPDVDFTVNSELLKNLLNSKNIVEHEKGHFSDDAGVTELPVVLDEILKI